MSNNNTYNITLTARGIDGSAKFSQRTFQDDTTVVFNIIDYNELNVLNFCPIKQAVSFGDGSPIQSKDISIIKKYGNSNQTVKIAEYDNMSDALFDVSHTYRPLTNTQYTALTAQVKITYSNFTNYYYYMPIIISHNTYLNQFNTLSIKNTQFVDLSANNIYMVLTTNRNDLYNLVLTD